MPPKSSYYISEGLNFCCFVWAFVPLLPMKFELTRVAIALWVKETPEACQKWSLQGVGSTFEVFQYPLGAPCIVPYNAACSSPYSNNFQRWEWEVELFCPKSAPPLVTFRVQADN